jgi:hypothetical protein
VTTTDDYPAAISTAVSAGCPAYHAPNIATRLSDAITRHELSRFYGEPPSWISSRMSQLRKEIRQQLGVPTDRDAAGRRRPERRRPPCRAVARASGSGTRIGVPNASLRAVSALEQRIPQSSARSS